MFSFRFKVIIKVDVNDRQHLAREEGGQSSAESFYTSARKEEGDEKKPIPPRCTMN